MWRAVWSVSGHCYNRDRKSRRHILEFQHPSCLEQEALRYWGNGRLQPWIRELMWASKVKDDPQNMILKHWLMFCISGVVSRREVASMLICSFSYFSFSTMKIIVTSTWRKPGSRVSLDKASSCPYWMMELKKTTQIWLKTMWVWVINYYICLITQNKIT